MTILVVDDNPTTLTYLHKSLSRFGYTVLTAGSAQEALAMLSKVKVNLILTDVNMPQMDGMEFCHIVRQTAAEEYIPVIFLTARSSVDDLATGMAAGADDYLTKPIRLSTLIAKIQEYEM